MTGKNLTQSAAFLALRAAAIITLAVLFIIIIYIMSNGLRHINTSFFLQGPTSMGRDGGIAPFIVSTLYVSAVSLVIAAPVGIGSALYLSEYSKGGLPVRIIRFCTETLAGIPSIIFGLFGFVFFVVSLGMGWSVLSGGLTLACMVLPTIIKTSEEAIKTVPDTYREGSMALGATKWQTIVKVVLPVSVPGIITGIILSIGRAVGETAAVILTAGSSLRAPVSITDPGRTMSVHLYVLTMEGISNEKAFATAAVLILFVLGINYAANKTATFIRRKV
ncbi:MAG: phosphate ABC transporter permease PstA [Firmicutes bacterium]|nr:phosphate ABC transporter permease PstA [Bacillota bacterium]MDD3298053.1 phosphate ABC transporter permease PstA [Bacillota bacterium]MDD3850503.1 phosphate ABC transporter permease PstA [Bacillota bacterium]MDD4707733.1 phosphate ABC transporter permease PstA [Bacillota bacterium]